MTQLHTQATLLIMLTTALTGTTPMLAQRAAPPSAPLGPEAVVNTIARGTFDVAVKPLPSDDFSESAAIGRMSLEKQWHGDFQGSSKGVMMATSTAVAGSAAYVAIEKVSGTLNGRGGSFSLQHSAWMAGGKQSMTITVVPDSGTEQLAGISGTLVIIIADGKHSYEFTYSIAGAP